MNANSLQEAQLSPSDRAMRLVSSNLANCHATVQKLSINQSIMLFRVVQVTKSLQDPLEVGNSLLGISDNVRE